MSPHPVSARPSRLASYARLVRLDKPIGILLLWWPTQTALWFASGGLPSLSVLLVFFTGTVLMRSAGCAMNDWADRDFDRHVQRTRERPLTSGAISGREALAVAAVLALAAGTLTFSVLDREIIPWAVVALLVAATYPFFKRFFAIPQAYLGIAFSFGIPMAFVAMRGHVPAIGWAMFAANLAWVVAYDTEYALVDIEDDRRLGLRTSALTFGRFVVPAVAGCYALYFAGLAAIGVVSGRGVAYAAGLVVGALFAARHLLWIRTRDRAACFRAFLDNHRVGLVVFVGTVLDFGLNSGVAGV